MTATTSEPNGEGAPAMRGFVGTWQYLPAESAEHVNHLVTLQALGNPGRVLSELDRRLFPRQPPVRHNPAYVPGKIVDLLVDEGTLHPEWGRISESRAMGCRGNGAPVSYGHYGRSARSPAQGVAPSMSLTSLLDTHPDLVQALVGLVPDGAIPPPVTTPMLAHPVTDHYALVGTSFDYLFRFEVQRRFPRARTQRWVAEQAVSMLGKGPGDERARARKVVLAARKNQREYLRSREPGPELLTRLAEDALRLAKLDSLYRSGTLDPAFDEASSRDVRDLLHLIRVIAFEGQMGALLREGSIRLNPTFGRYSGLVGGADADLIAGTTLVDLKVTKFPDFTDMHLAQLLGYSILADRYRQAERRRFPSLSRVGLYFARHGVLSILDLGEVRGNPRYVAVGDLLVGGPRARRPGSNLGGRIPVNDTRMPLRHDDRPVLALPKPPPGGREAWEDGNGRPGARVEPLILARDQDGLVWDGEGSGGPSRWTRRGVRNSLRFPPADRIRKPRS